MKYEQLRFKEALVIRYTNGKANGSMCLKADYPGFEEIRDETISALTKQNFEVKCEPVLYFDDSELEQYFKI